jgi:hypothetical protein
VDLPARRHSVTPGYDISPRLWRHRHGRRQERRAFHSFSPKGRVGWLEQDAVQPYPERNMWSSPTSTRGLDVRHVCRPVNCATGSMASGTISGPPFAAFHQRAFRGKPWHHPRRKNRRRSRTRRNSPSCKLNSATLSVSRRAPRRWHALIRAARRCTAGWRWRAPSPGSTGTTAR